MKVSTRGSKDLIGICFEGRDWHLLITWGTALHLYVGGHRGKHGLVVSGLLQGATKLFGLIPLSLLIW